MSDADQDVDVVSAVEVRLVQYRKRATSAEAALAVVSKERDEFARCLDGGVDCARERIAAENRESALRKALQYMYTVFAQDGLGDGAEGDAVEAARAALAQCPAVKG